ncbi:hypothetical protein C1X05_09775 [Laceyella sacchari]|nr:hypothetical protein C1X05_09775 [Laceyella sacchari]
MGKGSAFHCQPSQHEIDGAEKEEREIGDKGFHGFAPLFCLGYGHEEGEQAVASCFPARVGD